MPLISPLSSIDPKACVADDAEVGPFCVIGPHVRIGSGTRLLSHVVVTGHTTIGRNNVFHPNSVIGGIPQDKKYRGGPTILEIGDDNTVREAVTIHIGTEKGGNVTRIGNHNLLMVNAHIGHDAQIGNHCIIANNVMIAGHVNCGNHVAIMGGVGVHHYVTIGNFAYLSGYARVHHDVPPFVKVDGADQIRGLNKVGLERAGYSQEDVEALDDACRQLFYREKPLAVAMAEFDTMNGLNPQVKILVDFLRRRDLGRNGRFMEGKRERAK